MVDREENGTGRGEPSSRRSTTLELDRIVADHLASEAAGKAHTILVVDDDLRIRNALRRQLTAQGHEVLEASDAARGLAIIRARRVDLVFLDVMMPHGNGLEALEDIRRMVPRPKCVLMSGKASLLHKGAIDGADWVLSKPFNRTHLLTALEILYTVGTTP